MKTEIKEALAFAFVMLALAMIATLAHRLGRMDHDTVTRVVTIPMGLWMAWYGNKIPKRVAPRACVGQAQRVAGWSMVLSGLIYAGLWTFAPISTAVWVATGAVFVGVVVTLGCCLSLRSPAKAG